MKLLIAVTDQNINQKIRKNFLMSYIPKNIEYKEGILEVLEKNKKINFIILSENLPGEIELENLIKKVKIINSKIKILILIEKINQQFSFQKEENVEIIHQKFFDINKILNQLKTKQKKNNIIQILGNHGAGKTVFTYIMSEILLKEESKKILLIDDDIENNSLSKIYIKKNNLRDLIKIKNNLFLLNIQYFYQKTKINKNIKCNQYIQKIAKKFDLVIIDSKDNKRYFQYKEIVNKWIYIIEPNLIELKKMKKDTENKKRYILINKANKNSIDRNIIKKIFHQKIIGTIHYSSKIHKIINEENIHFLNQKEINNFYKIILKITKEKKWS